MCEKNNEMTKKEMSYEPIRLMSLDIQNKKRIWLEKQGWTESCKYPDSCWRWSKKIDSIIMICNKEKAIDIELRFVTDL